MIKSAGFNFRALLLFCHIITVVFKNRCQQGSYPASINLNRPQFAGGSKVSMDGAYGKK